MKKCWKNQIVTILITFMLLCTGCLHSFVVYATTDGERAAQELAKKTDKTEDWINWQKDWEEISSDWTQISLSPGADSSQLNFAWYSKKTSTSSAPKLKIGEGKQMSNVRRYTATRKPVKGEKDRDGNEYFSNKVTVKGLKPNTTYYYCYEKDGVFTEPIKYRTGKKNDFTFIFVGDPQIGSSNPLKGKKTDAFYDKQFSSVMSDSFCWNVTLEMAMQTTGGKAGFVVTSGDHIQTTKKKAPNKDATASEIEYAGYLCPKLLQSLPVATAVGNHDADNANYKYHFNPPNQSKLGSNDIVGGDYSFTYGNALFIMLNTQSNKVSEHIRFVQQAVKQNRKAKWKIVVFHQDIYGSGEHSNEPSILSLRKKLVPCLEASDIDVVLNGHDHTYSRSKILCGGKPVGGNMGNEVVNPKGILYITAGSSSGSKYYDLALDKQSYIAKRWQKEIPTYSVIRVTEDRFTIDTYRTDTNKKIDDSFTIRKK